MFDLKAFEKELIATLFAMSHSLTFHNTVCLQGITVKTFLRQDPHTDRCWFRIAIQSPGTKGDEGLHWIGTTSFYLGDPAAGTIIQESIAEQLQMLKIVGVFDQWYTDTLGTL